MAVFTLESLVLRGVSVLCGGKSVNSRLGTEYPAGLLAPTVGHPMPHPMPILARLADQAAWQRCCQTPDTNAFADRSREDERGASLPFGGIASRGPRDRSVPWAGWWCYRAEISVNRHPESNRRQLDQPNG